MHRSDDARPVVDRDHRGPADRVRLRGGRAPARPRHVLRDPARPGARALHARRQGGRVAHAATPARAGSGSTAACRSDDAHLGVLREGMAIDALDVARPLLRHEHRPGVRERRRGRELDRDRELPAGDRVGRGGGGRVAWPTSTCRPRCRRSSPTCRAGSRSTRRPSSEAIDRLDERWPGLRDRLCEPGPALRAAHQRLRRPRAGRARHRRSTPGSRVDVIAAISGG